MAFISVNKRIFKIFQSENFRFIRFLYRDAVENRDSDIDLLEVLTLLAKNPVG
jgi:hypothetical protein